MNENREFAARQLLPFLSTVGPVEAVWAMTTALEALKDLPADHVAVAAAAMDAALESPADPTEETPVKDPAPPLPPSGKAAKDS